MRRKFYTILRENTKSLAIVSEDTPMVAFSRREKGRRSSSSIPFRFSSMSFSLPAPISRS